MEVEGSPDLLVCYELTTIGHLLPASLSLSLCLSLPLSLTIYLYLALLSVYAFDFLSISGCPSSFYVKQDTYI